MRTGQKAGAVVGVLGLGQGFLALALTYVDPTPNETLAKWLFAAAIITVIAAATLFFWPSKSSDTPSVSASVAGTENAQAVSERDAVAQSGAGPNIAVQGEGNTVTYHHAAPTPEDDRVWITKTPLEIMTIYSATTELHAERSMAQFVGKWMRVEAKAISVTPGYFTQVSYSEGGSRSVSVVGTPKDRRSRELLDLVEPGDAIEVTGKFKKHWGLGIELDPYKIERVAPRKDASR